MKKQALCAAVAFTAVLTLLGGLTVGLPARSFSPNENRYLQTAPVFSAETVTNGRFQEEVTAYMNDQFPLRDFWTAAGAAIKQLLGRRDIGGAYVGRDHYYFEKITDTDFDSRRYARNLALVDGFAAAHPSVPVTVLPVPSAGTVLPDKLPPFAQLYDADAAFATAAATLTHCRLLDLRAALTAAAKTEQVYYRTDHHWTTRGAAVGYTALTGGAAPTLQPVTTDFLGTLYSKTLDAAAVPDTVETAAVSDAVSAVADGKAVPVYDSAALREKDKYKVFFGGNYGCLTLSGGNPDGGTLLILKDSFANCFAPLLAATYRTVVLVDLRYYAGTVGDLLTESGATEVLVLYEMSNFAADTNLAKLALG